MKRHCYSQGGARRGRKDRSKEGIGGLRRGLRDLPPHCEVQGEELVPGSQLGQGGAGRGASLPQPRLP